MLACKALGQHFLSERSVLEQVVEILKALPSEGAIQWVEVGPGMGALSRPCLAEMRLAPGDWVGIDLDKRMVRYLQSDPQLQPYTWVCEDALRFPYAQLLNTEPPKKLRWVGNLPYNVGTKLLVHWLMLGLDWDHMVLMLQKEVVGVICAQAGDSQRSRLSVLAEYFCSQRLQLLQIPPSAFTPAPRIHSALLRLDRKIPEQELPWSELEPWVERGFTHRRKLLAKNLKPYLPASTFSVLKDFIGGRRAQELDLDDWKRLLKIIKAGSL